MKQITVAIAVLALTVAVPSFAQPGGAPSEGAAGMHQMGHPDNKMLQSPRHLLMMAYHKNMITFARVLQKVARQGESVPPDVARTTVAEMKHSLDQMEKERTAAKQKMPPEMQKMMDEHLIAMKGHLRDLEILAKSDRIPSQEVLKHTQFLTMECGQTQCDLGKGKPGKGRHGMGGCDMHRGMGCDCMQMSPQHRQMMEQKKQRIKAQDQELAGLVDRMKRAPRDQKVDLLGDIVSRMVQQRTEFVNQMEKMQQEHMMHHQHMMMHDGATMPPPPNMTAGEDDESYDEDVDSYDNDGSEMDMQDSNMDDE